MQIIIAFEVTDFDNSASFANTVHEVLDSRFADELEGYSFMHGDPESPIFWSMFTSHLTATRRQALDEALSAG